VYWPEMPAALVPVAWCGIRCVPFWRPFWLRFTYVASVPVKKY
jgi:hypothetical protein